MIGGMGRGSGGLRRGAGSNWGSIFLTSNISNATSHPAALDNTVPHDLSTPPIISSHPKPDPRNTTVDQSWSYSHYSRWRKNNFELRRSGLDRCVLWLSLRGIGTRIARSPRSPHACLWLSETSPPEDTLCEVHGYHGRSVNGGQTQRLIQNPYEVREKVPESRFPTPGYTSGGNKKKKPDD